LVIFPGSHIYLAVWIRALQGDAAGQLAVTSYDYEIAVQDPQSGLTAGRRRQRSLGGTYADFAGTPVPGNPSVTYNDGAASPISPTMRQLFGASGAASPAGASAEINSNAAGDALGAFM